MNYMKIELYKSISQLDFSIVWGDSSIEKNNMGFRCQPDFGSNSSTSLTTVCELRTAHCWLHGWWDFRLIPRRRLEQLETCLLHIQEISNCQRPEETERALWAAQRALPMPERTQWLRPRAWVPQSALASPMSSLGNCYWFTGVLSWGGFWVWGWPQMAEWGHQLVMSAVGMG